jgi:hypothetical protein
MKQITLESHPIGLERPCLGRLFVMWGLYGLAMALLWRLAGGSPLVEAVVWTLAVGAGMGLLFGMREV